MDNEVQANKMRWQEIAEARCAIDSQRLQSEFNLSFENLDKLLNICLDFECKIMANKTFSYQEFEGALKQEFDFDYVQITEILHIFIKGGQFQKLAYIYTRLTSNDERLMQSGARGSILGSYRILSMRIEKDSEIKQIVDEVVENTKQQKRRKR